jgi:SAM-dependent methyltransferase
MPHTPSMTEDPAVWTDGARYEDYVGRWSWAVAAEFLRRLAVPPGRSWLDVGCGTGALTGAILRDSQPSQVTGVDSSAGFVAYARGSVTVPPTTGKPPADVRFLEGTAIDLPFDDGGFDATVSGLVLNFVPEPGRAALEMARVTRPGGTVAAYVWDYAGGMQLMRHFWNAAVELDPAALPFDEGRRSPLCQPPALRALFETAGLSHVDVEAVDVPTVFQSFDDYWKPFLGGTGPAPAYTVSLDEDHRDALRDRIRASLPMAPDGSIRLTARAWSVRGSR